MTAMTLAEALSRPLIFVTGKGGSGKTTVALAIALSARAAGHRPIVCEVASRREAPGLLGPGSPVATFSVDPRMALGEWLRRVIGAPGAALLTRSETFRYFVAAAPGARELVTIGKAWDLTRPRRRRAAFDPVVVDGPSTGQAEGMLRAPQTFASIGRVGPVGTQATQLRDALADPGRCALVVATLLTELSVSETLLFAERVAAVLGRGPDLVVANQALPDRYTRATLERVRRACAGGDDLALRAAGRAADLEWTRARAQERQRARLHTAIAAPIVELPFLPVAAMGAHELDHLAGLLVDGVTPRGRASIRIPVRGFP
jgi:hypothetical protein